MVRHQDWWRSGAAAVVVLLSTAVITAAELKVDTQRAWAAYAAATERRIAREVAGGPRFLVLDFGPNAASDHAALEDGRIVMRKGATVDPRGQAIEIPSGMMHHWHGAILVPGAKIGPFIAQLRSTPPEQFQKEVLQSSILAHDGDTTRMFLRLQRTKIVTVVFNTEHLVVYTRESPSRWSSSTHSLKIAEVANPGTSSEREKSQGQDRGFLWAWNTYWRYEQTDAGVIVECESISISRSIPTLVRYLVAPMVDDVARESMESTLTAIRDRFRK